jgi:FlaA1/EpsC-like NDP-sugar epimerase
MSEINLTGHPFFPRWPFQAAREPKVRRAVKMTLDALLAGAALGATSLLLRQGWPSLKGLLSFTALAMGLNVAFRFPTHHYRALGIEEARALLLGNVALVAGAMLLCAMRGHVWPGGEPVAVVLGASLLTGPLWFGARMVSQWLHLRQAASRQEAATGVLAQRTLIIGAGRAGVLLSQELREHPRLRCEVLGFVDDAIEKQGLRIHGIPVLGPTALLPIYIREQRATQVILGMAGVPGARLRELSEMGRAQGVQVKTVPGILNLVGDHPWRPEVRDIAIEDLLRRETITLDTVAIRQAVEGAVVVITGGGGSIGSELARRLAGFKPGKLVLLGRGENSLWEAQRELARLYPNQAVEIALCDIRNPIRLRQVFKALRPEVVLHAAAHKHVPFLEDNPEEAIENNIFGTRNVIDAALDWGTRTFVNVSTDKAVNPVNVLGVSKRIGEHLVAQVAAQAGPGVRFVSVRFGNVLGSRGSVIPVFREQIRQGGPITVTHPDMVRFFMTIPEAAQLVLQAGLLGDTGKVFALDMGHPVRILELAQEMARLSGFCEGRELDIRFTGIRPGEKLFEELFSPGEEQRTQVHVKVFEARQDPRDARLLQQGLRTLENLITYPERGRQQEILRCFMELVPTYVPSPTGLGRFLPPVAAPEERTLSAIA